MFATSVAIGGNAGSSAMDPLDSSDDGEYNRKLSKGERGYGLSPSIAPADAMPHLSQVAQWAEKKVAKSKLRRQMFLVMTDGEKRVRAETLVD